MEAANRGAHEAGPRRGEAAGKLSQSCSCYLMGNWLEVRPIWHTGNMKYVQYHLLKGETHGYYC